MNLNPLTEIEKIKLYPYNGLSSKNLKLELTSYILREKSSFSIVEVKKPLIPTYGGSALMHRQQRLRDKNLIRLQEGMAA